MTLKVGDKVKFLNDVGGGVITRMNKQNAFVETNDGFEIPTLFSELIKVEESGFGGLQATPQPDSNKKATGFQNPIVEREEFEDIDDIIHQSPTIDDEIITSENSTLNVILGIVPIVQKGKMEPLFDVFLISDCAYRFMYTFSVVRDNFVHGKRAGFIEDDTKVKIATFSVSELKTLSKFKINCIFYKQGVYLPHEPLVYEYSVDALAMVDPTIWEENDFFDQKSIIVNLTEMSLIYEIERTVTQNEERYIIQKKLPTQNKPVKQLKKQTPGIEEVDLHIEQLIDNHSHMTPGEIVELQLNRFTIALDGAIRNNTPKIVFIHGVGAGKLKYELTKTLERKYPKLRFQDASFKEYGFGATMVIIK